LISPPYNINMSKLVISEEARSEQLADLAIAINEIVRLPVTMRGAKHPGVRVEDGKVVDGEYTGPVLEEAIRTAKPIRTIPESGPFKGIPVSVAPVLQQGKAVAAIGIVDVIGTIDIPEVFGAYSNVVAQVSGEAQEKR
jgi:hypothetical protein